MWNIIAGLVPNIIGYFFDSPEVKQQKETNKTELLKAELEMKKAQMAAAAKAESDYDTQAVKNMQTSWKDEYIILLHTLPIYGYIIPYKPLHDGLDRIWHQLSVAPYEWWVIYIGIVASTFGLRWLFNKEKVNKMLKDKGIEKDKEQ